MGWQPSRIIGWQDAVTLFFLDKAEIVASYEEELNSPSLRMKMPAVIRLKRPLDRVKRGIKFSRINVFSRDRFCCQYCGQHKEMRELNYDHVVPRVRGGRTVWENIATCCYPCNGKKAGRTPDEAGMRLIRTPYKPKTLPMTFLQLDRKTIPDLWEPYCRSHGVEADAKGIYLITS